MDDLVAFLSARLDEDEAVAKACATDAAGLKWRGQDHPSSHRAVEDEDGRVVVWDEGEPDEAQAAHIARHDPARALREVAAKRAILINHEPGYPAVARQEPPGASTVTDPGGIVSTFPYCVTCDEDSPCSTLAHLAAIWGDHPDYRSEWKP